MSPSREGHPPSASGGVAPPSRAVPGGPGGPLRVGEHFLKYRILRLLGTGGHAWVYHGHDEFLDVGVAIKILHRQGGVTSDMLRRGQAEAKLLYRLKHENIVSVLDAGITVEGLLYIVMELLEGETLRQVLLRRGRLGVADALPLFARIADAVEAAHAFGAIHRDLKPENIFVLAGSRPKVLDFGIAKVVDAAGWTTEKDVIHGTILYMSPEQLRGARATAQSDVYAFGLMLFEALAGRHPLLLKNHSPTIKELTWMQLTVKPPPLDELDARIPRYVARLVERMILKLAENRPGSMSQCAGKIRACLSRMADTPAPSEDTAAARLNVTDKIHDTVRVEGPPFGASISLGRPAIFPAAPNAMAPIPRGPTDRLPDEAPLQPSRSMRAGNSSVMPEPPQASAGQSTVRPVTAAVIRTAPPRWFDEGERRWMLKVLAASCVTGAAMGGLYVMIDARSRELKSASSPSAGVALPPLTTRTADPAPPEAVASNALAPRDAASVAAIKTAAAASVGGAPRNWERVSTGASKRRSALPNHPKPRTAADANGSALPTKDGGAEPSSRAPSSPTPPATQAGVTLTGPILE